MSTSILLQRLLDQMQALSEINEALTLRLVELEEQVQGLDRRLQTSQIDLAEGETSQLAAADDRIGRIRHLLGPGANSVMIKHSDPDVELFVDEPEQLFMDETLQAEPEEPFGHILTAA
jgi:hypothetical protein